MSDLDDELRNDKEMRSNDELPEENLVRFEENTGLSSPLASEESMRNSLESLRQGRAGLNKHRQSLLNRVPDRDTYASFPLNTVEDKDLAYLSAETGDEFALLRGKHEDILYHGTQLNCHIENSDSLMALLQSHKLRLEIHSHPDYGAIKPSFEDRMFLRAIGQKKSKIISSYTGQIQDFSDNRFEDF